MDEDGRKRATITGVATVFVGFLWFGGWIGTDFAYGMSGAGLGADEGVFWLLGMLGGVIVLAASFLACRRARRPWLKNYLGRKQSD